jgi:hypothetical protein
MLAEPRDDDRRRPQIRTRVLRQPADHSLVREPIAAEHHRF